MVLKIKFKDYDDIAVFMGKPLLLTVTITNELVKITKDKERLLETRNNIHACIKLNKILESQEADLYAIVHFGIIITYTMDKQDFMNNLKKCFGTAIKLSW